MFKRKWVLLVVLVVILASTTSAFDYVGKRKMPVEFRPWAGYVEIGYREYPVLIWGWGACSQGLDLDFLGAVVQNVYVYQDGVMIGEYLNAGEWSDPSVSGTSEACLHGDGSLWTTWMTFEDLGIRDAGTYEVHTEFYLLYPLTDGGDSDGDGYLDIYNPNQYWVTTVVVLE